MGNKMTDEYEEWYEKTSTFWEDLKEDENLVDVKAQWQIIFVALWGSGAFDTQEAAKRKTDEIIANRPSLGETLAAPMVITEKEDND